MAKDDEDKQAAVADDLLIREVDEELRAERLQNWWQQFGSLLVGACLTIILATIAYQLATSYQNTKAEERTTLLLEAQNAIDKGQTETALKKLSTLAEEDSAAAEMAKLQIAKLEQENDDSDHPSSQSYEAIMQQDDYPVMRDVATMQSGQFEKLDAESPFYPLAAEQKVITLLKDNKKDEARSMLLSLLDRKDLPSDQRMRLNELLQGAN